MSRPRRTNDHELDVIGRMFDLLGTLHMDGRVRVMNYVGARLNSLPTLAQVSDGQEQTTDEPILFSFGKQEKAATGEALK